MYPTLLSTVLAVPLLDGVLSTTIYALIGILLSVIGFKVVDMMIPGKMSRQIAEEKNVAIAIIGGAMILGICIIIAASIVG